MNATGGRDEQRQAAAGGDAAPLPQEAKSSDEMTITATFDDDDAQAFTGAPKAGPSTAPPLAPELQGHIGKHLRAVYGDLVKQPIPERLKRVLEDLAASERGGTREKEEK